MSHRDRGSKEEDGRKRSSAINNFMKINVWSIGIYSPDGISLGMLIVFNGHGLEYLRECGLKIYV